MTTYTNTNFHAIYFIHANTGAELVSKQTPVVTFDVNLITGMFNALETFINHLAYSNEFETLQDINFQGLSIIYERYGRDPNAILCVGVCDRELDSRKCHSILHQLVQDFYTTFTPEIRNFKGIVKPFKQFLPYLETFSNQLFHFERKSSFSEVLSSLNFS